MSDEWRVHGLCVVLSVPSVQLQNKEKETKNVKKDETKQLFQLPYLSEELKQQQ